MIPKFRPLCSLCDYLVSGNDPDNDRGKPVCRAFPEGIPDDVWAGGFDHRQPYRNETVTFKLDKAYYTQADVEKWERHVLEVEKLDMLAMIDQYEQAEEPTDL
jgi:hypothetical protein